jgi:hypothetical protein
MPFDFSPVPGSGFEAGHPRLDRRIAAILADWRPLAGEQRRPAGRVTAFVYRLIAALGDGRAR